MTERLAMGSVRALAVPSRAISMIPAMSREQLAKKREGNEVEFGRIVAFSDGVFSIAITLLVLNLKVPTGLADGEVAHALLSQHDRLLAYAISFAVIGRNWLVHHRFFSEVTGFDSRLIGLNMFYLAWIVLIPFSSQAIGEYGGTTASDVLYSGNLAAVIIVGLLMSADARRAGLTSIDLETHHENLVRSFYISSVFLLSIPVAFLDPHVAPYMWFLLFLDPSSRLVRRISASRSRR